MTLNCFSSLDFHLEIYQDILYSYLDKVFCWHSTSGIKSLDQCQFWVIVKPPPTDPPTEGTNHRPPTG